VWQADGLGEERRRARHRARQDVVADVPVIPGDAGVATEVEPSPAEDLRRCFQHGALTGMSAAIACPAANAAAATRAVATIDRRSRWRWFITFTCAPFD